MDWSSENPANTSDFNLLNDSAGVNQHFSLQALQEELDTERTQKATIKEQLDDAERECVSLRQKLLTVEEKLSFSSRVSSINSISRAYLLED